MYLPSSAGPKGFLLFKTPRRCLKSSSLLPIYSGVIFLHVKQPGREANNFSSPNAEIKNE
jgi:hypothetical protein